MHNGFKILMLHACLIGASVVSVNAQDSANPLDKFRTNNNGGQQSQQQAQQVPQRRVNAPSINNGGQIPTPTVGGFQQQGLSQEDINGALANYNFGDGLSYEEQVAESERLAREAAFEATLNGALPLNPDEILELLDRYREVREARETRLGGTPTPEITFETVSLDPSATPPILKLSPGHVTTLNIVDLSG